ELLQIRGGLERDLKALLDVRLGTTEQDLQQGVALYLSSFGEQSEEGVRVIEGSDRRLLSVGVVALKGVEIESEKAEEFLTTLKVVADHVLKLLHGATEECSRDAAPSERTKETENNMKEEAKQNSGPRNAWARQEDLNLDIGLEA